MFTVMNPQGFSATSLFSKGKCLSDESQFGVTKDHISGCSVELSSDYAGYTNHSNGLPSSEELEVQTIGNLLPDDDDLFSGVTDGFDSICRLTNGEEVEELDLFSSVGGLELGDDGFSKGAFSLGSSCGEYPIGELPSRTLFVRNIKSNVEDSELRTIFEQYGDIHTLYTASKLRGFVMITYFDIRAAYNAMKALQNKPLKHQRLDIHFSFPKENPSEKDINQGRLAVFNLDSSVSNNELLEIFGVYGEVKEIHDTPRWSDQRVVEYYDIRSAEAALRDLNKIQIAGKQIQLELCSSNRFMHPASSEVDNVESGCLLNQQSLPTILPSDKGTMLGFHNGASSYASNGLLTRTDPRNPSNITNHLQFEIQSPSFNPHSVPEYNNVFSNGVHVGGSPSTVSADFSPRNHEIFDGQQFRRVVPNGQPVETQVFGSAANGNCNPCHLYMWNNSHHVQPRVMLWPNSPSFYSGIRPVHPVARAPHIASSVLNHHVGSAPSVDPWDLHSVYAGSPDGTVFHPGSLGNLRITGTSPHPLDYVPHDIFSHSATNGMDSSIPSKNIGLHSQQKRCMNLVERVNERSRHHRSDGSSSLAENRKQFELDIERIIRGEDQRTTLMIKNIPNKYTSKMLMAAIDERHKGTYDFIYLPIDFKNKCNVGYAFINMIEPSLIVPLHKTLNGKKWEKFNSEKVASLAYARIQGKSALIAHFQNSSLMNEDKRCRPILFNTEGPNAGDQVPFPVGANVRSRPLKLPTSTSDENALNSDDSVVD